MMNGRHEVFQQFAAIELTLHRTAVVVVTRISAERSQAVGRES